MHTITRMRVHEKSRMHFIVIKSGLVESFYTSFRVLLLVCSVIWLSYTNGVCVRLHCYAPLQPLHLMRIHFFLCARFIVTAISEHGCHVPQDQQRREKIIVNNDGKCSRASHKMCWNCWFAKAIRNDELMYFSYCFNCLPFQVWDKEFVSLIISKDSSHRSFHWMRSQRCEPWQCVLWLHEKNNIENSSFIGFNTRKCIEIHFCVFSSSFGLEWLHWTHRSHYRFRRARIYLSHSNLAWTRTKRQCNLQRLTENRISFRCAVLQCF